MLNPTDPRAVPQALPPVVITATAPHAGCSLRTTTLTVAQAEHGVHEQGGDNRGPRVEQYQKAGKTTPGQPWCACYVNWCAEVAARQCGCTSPLEAVPTQAYVQSYVDHAKRHGLVVTRPEPGDLFCVWFPSLNRYAHIGFVKSVDRAAGTFRTLEGNSNDAGTREGVEVCTNTRAINGRILFYRWA